MAFLDPNHCGLRWPRSTLRPAGRPGADYVCTGNGNLAVIQTAFDALPDDHAAAGEWYCWRATTTTPPGRPFHRFADVRLDASP